MSYAYLWAQEAAQGREEAVKDRPAVVVLAVSVRDHLTEVTVAPVTTRPPRSGDQSIEVPLSVKRHLGLDDQRCWIVTTEVNRFNWPGPDVRPIVRKSDRSPYYGKIPGRLLEQVREKIAAQIEGKRFRLTNRTE